MALKAVLKKCLTDIRRRYEVLGMNFETDFREFTENLAKKNWKRDFPKGSLGVEGHCDYIGSCATDN